MHHSSLRKVGGSVMLTIPRAVLDQLDLQAGARVELAVADGRLLIEPARKPRYTLAQLLEASDYTLAAQTDEDAAWVGGAAAGREIL